MKQILHKVLQTIIILTFLGLAASVAGAAFVFWQVYLGDHQELQKTTIMAKIKEETSIYYLDESTRIGSLFTESHRRYVPIEEIPSHMINAIVAAEDKNYYNHFGVDPVATVKAAFEGLLKSGRLRRGGSTLTQQTVKNILGDWEPSIARKFREMIKALQLELLYNKRQILEFYLNQFHVAGNGNGIGIAARYYFNKDARDLTLVEAAFIAGSVKGPSKYNPFIKNTQEERLHARRNADERKNYVLNRMYEQGWISKEDYDETLKVTVPFNRGEFTSSEVALITLIKEQLEKPEVLASLGLGTIDDFNIAGLKVFTTLDYDMQNAAQLAIRRNLSRIETMLSGFAVEDPQKYKERNDLSKDDFIYGKVVAKKGTSSKDFSLVLTFGIAEGTISHAALERYAKIMDYGNGRGVPYHLEQLYQKIALDSVLMVQVTEFDPKINLATLELQKRPNISGGMLALDKGEVRAVVSGFDTLGYNRAMHAKRQAGSVFKTLVYFASLQLGWSILDRLDNMRQVFPYQGKLYFPRPDHVSPYAHPSMLWSGIKSENVASVALTADLLAKINFDQFRQLLGVLGLSPEAGETTRNFHYRISKKIGVSLDNEGIKAQQLTNSINEMAPDLIFAEQNSALQKLQQMWWGDGYIEEAAALRAVDQTVINHEEAQVRFHLLMNNYQRMRRLDERMRSDWQQIAEVVEKSSAEAAFANPELRPYIRRFYCLGREHHFGYQSLLPEEAAQLSEYQENLLIAVRDPLTLEEFTRMWSRTGEEGSSTVPSAPRDKILLGGYLTSSMLGKLAANIHTKYQQLMEEDKDDPYHLQRYFQHFDFRIGIGLTYLARLAEAAGAFSHIDPVLSFPLGSSDLTIGEVAKIYQTFVQGKTYRFYKSGPKNQINFIKRIEDRAGNILFEPKVSEHQLVDPDVALQTCEILRKVVTHGTGSTAKKGLFLHSEKSRKEGLRVAGPDNIRVPSFGKTGTTNDYRINSFAGYLPYPKTFGKPLTVDNSYVITSYVGYDNNKSMIGRGQKIYAAQGALPGWVEFAEEVINLKDYKSFLDPLDLKVVANKEWPLTYPGRDTQMVAVDLASGSILKKEKAAAAEGAEESTTSEELIEEAADSKRATVLLPATSFFKGNAVPRKFQPFTSDSRANSKGTE
jgi:membrane peptidoglycan carboxypeptidase